MNILVAVWSEFVGLFLDDEFLAVAILAVVATAAVLAFAVHAPGLATGGVLLAGCVIVLLVSVWRGAGKS